MSKCESKINFQVSFLEAARKYEKCLLVAVGMTHKEKLARIGQFIEEEGLTGLLTTEDYFEKIEALPTAFQQVKEFLETLYVELPR